MGIFDKLKTMAGGHGVTVRVTRIDEQAVTDQGTIGQGATELTGRIEVHATKEVVISTAGRTSWMSGGRSRTTSGCRSTSTRRARSSGRTSGSSCA